jgi:hypothetical protein
MGGQAKTPEAAAAAFDAAMARFFTGMTQALEALVAAGLVPSKLPAEGVGGDSPASSPATQGAIAPREAYGLEVEFDGKPAARQQTSSNDQLLPIAERARQRMLPGDQFPPIEQRSGPHVSIP